MGAILCRLADSFTWNRILWLNPTKPIGSIRRSRGRCRSGQGAPATTMVRCSVRIRTVLDRQRRCPLRTPAAGQEPWVRDYCRSDAGVGICANSTVFSWIDGTMLHPIPGARETSDLVSVMRGQWNISPSPPLSYLDYRDLARTESQLRPESSGITTTGSR
jgi:hypothetical protein